MVYPFKMSLESFKFDYGNREQKAFTDKIQATLNRSTLVNHFISSLDQLTNPDLLYHDYIKEINSNLRNREAFYKIFREMFVNLIECSTINESPSDGLGFFFCYFY